MNTLTRRTVLRPAFGLGLSALLLLACGGAGTENAASPNAAGGSIPPVSGTLEAREPGASGNNLFWNSDFEEGTKQPWSAVVQSPAKGSFEVKDGKLCLKAEAGGKQTYDVAIRQRALTLIPGHKYTVSLQISSTVATKARIRLGQSGPPYQDYWSALLEVGATPTTYSATFDMASQTDLNGEFAIHLGGPLAATEPFELCIDNLQLNDPEFDLPASRKAGPVAKVRVNQVGYLPGFEKRATIVNGAKEPLPFVIVDASGAEVFQGKTTVFGEDKAAGEFVHTADFSTFKKVGTGYRIKVGADQSDPFAIGTDIYRKMKYDALAFFYHQRSGIAITMPYAGGEQWTRPAGHPGDKSIPCAPGTCDYSLDVSGGWYDAGDHGKYVVNGGISLWTMLNQYETFQRLGKTGGDFADGKMAIPENKNGVPDILDEARWEMELMLRMQVPAGKKLAGMVHHKMHSEKWTSIPTMPDEDPIKRFLKPPSTAATLNMAANAAQAARIWKTIDPAFSKKCLTAAETAWAAAKANPAVLAPGDDSQNGGGAYGDVNLDDEFYWAAAELFITTGKGDYRKEVESSKFFKLMPRGAGGGSASMTWDMMAALGTISLLTTKNDLPAGELAALQKQLVDVADFYLSLIPKRGYRVPMASETKYPWGSNSFILNNMLVMAFAYDLTKNKTYAQGVVDGMDYLLGRNPNGKSYVTGYGTRPLENPHHRFWARQANPKFPSPPPGIVSGGPNSGLEDPYTKVAGLPGCAPQKCYVDNIESWSTNEITINWNAPFAWVTAFLDEQGSN